MTDEPGSGRWQIPALMALLIALYAGSRMEETRELEATVLAVLVPIVCPLVGLRPLLDASGALRLVAPVVSLVAIALTELRVLGAIVKPHELGAISAQLPARAAALTLLFVAAGVEAWAAARSLRSRYTAWTGIALGMLAFLPPNVAEKQRLGSIFASLFVGFFAGGGAGLVLGEFAARSVRERR